MFKQEAIPVNAFLMKKKTNKYYKHTGINEELVKRILQGSDRTSTIDLMKCISLINVKQPANSTHDPSVENTE